MKPRKHPPGLPREQFLRSPVPRLTLDGALRTCQVLGSRRMSAPSACNQSAGPRNPEMQLAPALQRPPSKKKNKLATKNINTFPGKRGNFSEESQLVVRLGGVGGTYRQPSTLHNLGREASWVMRHLALEQNVPCKLAWGLKRDSSKEGCKKRSTALAFRLNSKTSATAIVVWGGAINRTPPPRLVPRSRP